MLPQQTPPQPFISEAANSQAAFSLMGHVHCGVERSVQHSHSGGLIMRAPSRRGRGESMAGCELSQNFRSKRYVTSSDLEVSLTRATHVTTHKFRWAKTCDSTMRPQTRRQYLSTALITIIVINSAHKNGSASQCALDSRINPLFSVLCYHLHLAAIAHHLLYLGFLPMPSLHLIWILGFGGSWALESFS